MPLSPSCEAVTRWSIFHSQIMNDFQTMRIPTRPTTTAPDGSDVRVLLATPAGGVAHFELAAEMVARAVTHRTVDEIWYILSGRGEMWRKQGEQEETVTLEVGVCISIPQGTHFQFRASTSESVAAIAVTMPPWPGDGEAVVVAGPWEATITSPPNIVEMASEN